MSIKDAMDGKLQAEGVKAQQDVAGAINSFAEDTAAALAQMNDAISFIANKTEEAIASISMLYNPAADLVNAQIDSTIAIENLSANGSASGMASGKDGGSKEAVTHLSSMSDTLKKMFKLNTKESKEQGKFQKAFNKVSKAFTKKDKKETKTVTPKDAVKTSGKGGKAGTPKLDSKMIASKMADAAASALNPIGLVTAFLAKVLPLLIVLGILIYGFITGFLKVDVKDGLSFLVKLIIGAVLLYIAWMMAQYLIAQGIKIFCEFLKVAIEATADWAAVYVIIAVIGIIALAFLLAAAMIIVIIGLALIGIVIAVWLITDVITSMIEDMTEDIMDIMGEQFEKLSGMIVAVVDTFTTLVPMMADMMMKMADNLRTGINEAMIKVILTFTMMSAVMNHLANEISDIFNGLAAAIISSALFKSVKQTQEAAKDLTINTLNAEFKTNPILMSLLAKKISDSLYNAFSVLVKNVSTVVSEIAEGTVNIITGIVSGIATMLESYNEFVESAIEGLTDIVETVIAGIVALVETFIGILIAMPLLGMMMGLIGSNSFSDAIAPLIKTTKMIEGLLKDMVDANVKRETSYVRTQSYNASNFDDETAINNIHNATSYVQPIDAEKIFSEAVQVSSSRNSNVEDPWDERWPELVKLFREMIKVAGSKEESGSSWWPW